MEAALTAALSGVLADFSANLAIIIPVTFGLAVAVLIYKRVKGLVR
jgi:hypothetical protein